MKKIFLSISIFILFIILSPIASAATPELLFSDLTDGTVTGWNGGNQKGAAVSIWGYGFGSSRGSSYVTVGGVNLTDNSDYAEWGATTNPTTANGQERITFWLKPSMTLGNTTITVTTSEGTSTSIPFYTRNTGNIYFVARDGDDNNAGNTLAAPFFSPGKAKRTMVAGDVSYIRSGIWREADSDGGPSGGSIIAMGKGMFNNGTIHNTISIVAYPGESSQLGTGADSGEPPQPFSRSGNNDTLLDNWTFSKLSFIGWRRGLRWSSKITGTVDQNFRLIGLNIRTRHAEVGQGNGIVPWASWLNVKMFGNYFHHIGKLHDDDPHGYKTSSIYFGGGGVSDGIEIAYNEFYKNNGASVKFFGHFRSNSVDNLIIHDNFSHECGTQPMVLGGGDPQADPQYAWLHNVEVYNNIFTQHGGAVRVATSSNGLSGDFDIHNNTFYNNGLVTGGPEIQTQGQDSFNFHDNLVIKGPDNNHTSAWSNDIAGYEDDKHSNNETGSHNTWYGFSSPAWSTGDVAITSDDQFVSANPITYQDFRIKDTSPLYGQNIGARILGGQSQNNHRADVNNSESIDSTDAMLTLRSSLGLNMSNTNWQASASTGDVNCDDVTNLTDVNLILKYSLGLDVSGEGWCIN